MTVDRTLAAVRADIDAVDLQLHELIIRRTQLVEEVRRIKRDWSIKIQPSREAEIVYRLMERHHGSFPKRELVLLWRTLIVATLSLEGPFTVAVYMPSDNHALWDVARDHFGLYTPMTRHGSVRSAIEAVHRREATLGVLPMPRHDDPDPWWRHLVTTQPTAPRIIARLPFAGPGNGRADGPEALAICPVTVVPTGRDRSFLAFETDERLGLSPFNAALAAAGFETRFSTLWHEEERPHISLYCVEVEGFVGEDDARLKRIRSALGTPLKRQMNLGGYAVPLTASQLAATTSPSPEEGGNGGVAGSSAGRE